MSELDRLRDEVRASQRRAGAKVSRLNVKKGVRVANTKFDVRRDSAKIKTYNTKQLNAYNAELKLFTSRATTFVAGDGGAPLPGAAWRRHERAIDKFNAIGNSKRAAIDDIRLPGLGVTIAERRAGLSNKVRRADGEIANRPFEPISKKPSAYPDAEALAIGTRSFEKRSTEQWTEKQYRLARKQSRGMLDKIGDVKLANRVKRLSRDQFDTLWNHSQFISELLPDYLKALVDSKQMNDDDLIEAMNSEGKRETVIELIDWASNLPKSRAPKAKRK